MAQRLFKTGKVGAFVDTYSPGIEKRRGEDISVVTVKFRVQPFDAKLATALDDGVGGDSNIRPTVFTMSGNADPKPNFTRHDFKLSSLPRQNLELFPAPDTEASRIALTQAKISGCYVRTQKDINALALIFKATFGPVGRDELEMIHSLHRSQTFITFQEAEPLLDEEDDGEDDGTDAEQKAQQPIDGRVPMWEDEAPAPSPAAKRKARKNVNRKLHSHAGGKKKARR
jgi:hypothetical protein